MNDLDNTSEKILKQIIEFDGSLTPENFGKIRHLKKFSDKELSECLSSLKASGFIVLNDSHDLITSTFKAKQYFMLKNKKRSDKILYSFVFPLLVALLTSLITTTLTLWSQNLLAHT